MPSLPLVVIAEARSLAWRCGIDGPSALSLTAEAWADHPDPMWRTVAHRRCVDERRRLSGRNGDDHRPIAILDEPARDGAGSTVTIGELMPCEDPGYAEAESRCDLVALIGDLPDADLAALARRYWLGLPVKSNSPDDVSCTRAIRRARRTAKATRAPVVVAPTRFPPPPEPAPPPLSARELQVVAAMADGLTRDAAGHRLHLSGNTIKSHMARIAAKVGADNTTHVVALALRAGWIT